MIALNSNRRGGWCFAISTRYLNLKVYNLNSKTRLYLLVLVFFRRCDFIGFENSKAGLYVVSLNMPRNTGRKRRISDRAGSWRGREWFSKSVEPAARARESKEELLSPSGQDNQFQESVVFIPTLKIVLTNPLTPSIRVSILLTYQRHSCRSLAKPQSYQWYLTLITRTSHWRLWILHRRLLPWPRNPMLASLSLFALAFGMMINKAQGQSPTT